jgi:hypothetical protein
LGVQLQGRFKGAIEKGGWGIHWNQIKLKTPNHPKPVHSFIHKNQRMRTFLLLLCLLFLFPSFLLADTPVEQLPECPYVDPAKDLERWSQLPVFPQKCNVSKDKPEDEADPEHGAYERGVHR